MPLRNVFQIWMDVGQKVPFAVRNAYHKWHPETYYLVKKVEISARNWDYYQKKKGGLYGNAWGDLHVKGQLVHTDVPVRLAGTYEWVLLEGKS
jgi:hypothetical protein